MLNGFFIVSHTLITSGRKANTEVRITKAFKIEFTTIFKNNGKRNKRYVFHDAL